MMRKATGVYVWAGLLVIIMTGAWARVGAENLPRGKDVIYVPAMSKGLCVDNLFQSNMVLQRGKPIAIWGWAPPGRKITVTFDRLKQSAKAGADRYWKVTFPSMTASDTPRTMVIQGDGKTVTLDNILIGDVWVAGGQSNMDFPIGPAQNGDLAVEAANFKNIRLLTIPENNTTKPVKSFPEIEQWSGWSGRHYRRGFWRVCTPKSVGSFSAIAFIFARQIYMTTHIPIGIVNVSRGGTTLQTWTPIAVLKSIHTPAVETMLNKWKTKIADYSPQADLEGRIKHYNYLVKIGKAKPGHPPTDLQPGPAGDFNRPGTCYDGMLAPMTGLRVKGVIWHQGFNNSLGNRTTGGEMYEQIFPKMIAAWRKAFDAPDMPFGILSLCTDGAPQTNKHFLEGLADNGCYIRWAQYKTFLNMSKAGDKNIGFCSTFDFRWNWYHPQIKIPAGLRIARWALATQYGYSRQIPWLPPIIEKMNVTGNQIVLQLTQNVAPYRNDAVSFHGFMIAGNNRKFYPAKAVYGKNPNGRGDQGNVIVLSSPFVSKPVAYRYAWARNPMGNVVTTGGASLPLAIQRSDHWTMNQLYKAYTGRQSQSPTVLNGYERHLFMSALKNADISRRLQEDAAFCKAHEPTGVKQ
ncbi:MAG: hypothetical protein ACP5O7_03255 [Phycisphaerae bacterium]